MTSFSHRLPRQGGFTLLEILIVVAIIAILAAVVVPKIVGRVDDAQISKVKSDIKALEAALDLYRLDNFQYPSTEQGLEALVAKPSGEPEPRNYPAGGYIKRLEKDPWGRDYQYLNPGEHGDVDIFSLGADGQLGGEGLNADIGNWEGAE
ncbi:MAG TPA: type II secretion system protein GspG [Gammaproteobacteria bacterium]|nr:type II secretion system protein GspG [Gammaproteobacteria bacterium]